MTSPQNSVAIQSSDLGKRFGSNWILAYVNLKVQRGQSIALFGGNGSGKSTLLKMIAGLLKPSFGSIQVSGRLGFLGHEKQLYADLTVRENIKLAANLLGVSKGSEKIDSSLELLQMRQHQGQRVREISEGMKKRLALAKLLLIDGELILLDEPHAGLDTAGKEILHELFGRWHHEQKTVIIASHDHETVLPHVDRILTLVGGLLSE